MMNSGAVITSRTVRDVATARTVFHPLVTVALACMALQIASATLLTRDLETPNASTEIARSLVEHGRYGIAAWHRLRGPDAVVPPEPLKAFQLPGEPLYLALGFRSLPEAAWRYLHVPITIAFVTAVAAVGLLVGGRSIALATGLLASADPFIVVHGPVWDDAFLGAAAEWTVLACFLSVLARAQHGAPDVARRRMLFFCLLAAAAACGASARAQSQIVMAIMALAAILSSRFKGARRLAWAVLLGIAIAVGGWGARNVVAVETFFVGTSHDGLTLFESNYAHAQASILQTGTAEGFSQTHLGEEFARVAGLSELEADRQFRRDAWTYIASHPLEVGTTALLKLAVSLTGVHFGQPLLSPRNIAAVGSNLWLLAVAPYGLWLLWRRSNGGDVDRFMIVGCAAMCATTVGLLLLGPVGLRYRMDVAGLLYIGTGAALTHLIRAAAQRRPSNTVAA
jgi:hypothetical protein